MSNVQEWQQLANKELSRREKTVDSLVHQTAEGIAIKPLYTEADLDNLEVRVWTCSKSVDSGRVIMCATLWAGAVAHTLYL